MAAGLLLAFVQVPQAGGASAPAAPTGRLYVVQAVPGSTYTVTIDGDELGRAELGTVLGPVDLAPGDHDIAFSGDGAEVTTTATVRSGSSSDLVVHLPAESGGDPVVDVYAAPMKPIGPAKARVLVAHTATVPPADLQVDGTTVFENIANGEYVEADLPAGAHTASVVPAGKPGDPLLGPLNVDLPAGTLTMVYAVGTPRNGSMSVVSHQVRLDRDGAVAPEEIDTGSAGLVSGVRVRPFGRF